MPDEPTQDTLPEVPPAMAEPPGPVESAVVAAIVPPVARQIMLGRVRIDWDELPDGIGPLGINHDELEGKCYKTQSRVTFSRGAKQEAEIRKGYAFDGASVPHIFWGFRGFSPIGRHLWAALLHDAICDEEIDIWPVVGDALFVAILKESGVPAWRAAIMYLGVRLNHIVPDWLSTFLGSAWRILFRLAILVLAGFGLWKLYHLIWG